MTHPEQKAERLAPMPDFRYVGLEPGAHVRVGLWATLFGASATMSAALVHGFGVRGLAVSAISTTVAALAMRKVATPPSTRRWGAKPVPMAIVPWGVIVEPDERMRVLRWAAVERVHVEMVHGRDGGTSTTLFSVVTIETERERFAGRTSGAVGLENLLVHLEAYEREQAHRVAIDLDGVQAGEGPTEPEIEPLLAAAQAFVASACGTERLSLPPPSGYREPAARSASRETVAALRDVLRDRAAKPCDPRAFAAVCAAELGARELAGDLVNLVQSPHPIVAAVAKVSAAKLGAGGSQAGSIDEVAPFLLERDVSALEAWARR